MNLLSANAKLPTRESPYSPGYDITLSQSTILQKGEIKELHTGIGLSIDEQEDFIVMIHEKRNEVLKYNIRVIEGIINTEHQGEVLIAAENLAQEAITIPEGSSIAQLLFVRVLYPVIKEGFCTFLSTYQLEELRDSLALSGSDNDEEEEEEPMDFLSESDNN